MRPTLHPNTPRLAAINLNTDWRNRGRVAQQPFITWCRVDEDGPAILIEYESRAVDCPSACDRLFWLEPGRN